MADNSGHVTARSDDLTDELAREIRAAVAESTPVESGSAASRLDTKGFSGVRTPLARAEHHVTPTVPEAARFFGAKSAAVRLLRFLWRGQASFNALLLEAGNGVAGALEEDRAAIDRLTLRITEEVARTRTEFLRRNSGQDARLAHLESLRSSPATAPGEGGGPAAALPESVYSLFEERFRGSAEDVARKQRFYLPFLRDLPGPVLDAGCGRGEFLRLLAEEGIPARGVEASGVAATSCRAAGLDVREGDAVTDLAAAPSRSLGAVVAFQVVEHWPAAQTFRFLAQARRAVAPGGVLIVETVNTNSLSAMNAFYLDPTHVRPVPPEALSFLCEAAGFRDLQVEFLSPLPANERLAESSENDARLNEMLFGPQDYAVIARVPTE
jgi:2-polyprenyl-3-methyl-5-hydroxy-6-metoxy-1,4-benzoquinol methylase